MAGLHLFIFALNLTVCQCFWGFFFVLFTDIFELIKLKHYFRFNNNNFCLILKIFIIDK